MREARVTYNTPGHFNEIIVGFEEYNLMGDFIPKSLERELMDYLAERGLYNVTMNRGTRIEIYVGAQTGDTIAEMVYAIHDFLAMKGYDEIYTNF